MISHRDLILGLIFLAFCLACTRWIASAPSEDSATSVANQCPLIHEVSHRPLGEIDFSGAGEEVNSNGFRDFYLHDHDGKFKVGMRKTWGGALVFFGKDDGKPGANASNVLDASLSNRGVQVAFRDDARAYQGCAYNAGCMSKKPGQAEACSPHDDFPGWNPTQGGTICGYAAEAEGVSFSNGLVSTVVPLFNNPAWSLKGCAPGQSLCNRSELAHSHAKLRISQSLRFVRPGILEVEVLATNLDDSTIVANQAQTHALPYLFASAGHDGTQDLGVLKNVTVENADEEKRVPAAATTERSVRYLHADGGWAAYENLRGDSGVGIYWENRSPRVRADALPGSFNSLRSNYAFALPPRESVQARYYLLLGTHEEIVALATELDKTLPPFGRIETNHVEDDTRTVTLEGWALDNKAVTGLELWINGKKAADVELNMRRDDICAAHPGYAMCLGKNPRVGFSTTYQRPEGQGCDMPVEIRARDGDGNWRVIARKAIAPVRYN